MKTAHNQAILTVFALLDTVPQLAYIRAGHKLAGTTFTSDEISRRCAILIVLVFAVLNCSTETAGQQGLKL
jgi:hypothetical protein